MSPSPFSPEYEVVCGSRCCRESREREEEKAAAEESTRNVTQNRNLFPLTDR